MEFIFYVDRKDQWSGETEIRKTLEDTPEDTLSVQVIFSHSAPLLCIIQRANRNTTIIFTSYNIFCVILVCFASFYFMVFANVFFFFLLVDKEWKRFTVTMCLGMVVCMQPSLPTTDLLTLLKYQVVNIHQLQLMYNIL